MTKTPVESAKSFLDYRKNQEKKIYKDLSKINDPLKSIFTVEINATEMCNRTCVFCPRFDPKVYPNRNLHMTVKTIEGVSNALKNINYKNKISFSGFGENFLNKKFYDLVYHARQILKTNLIECNTNGDTLNIKNVKKIFDCGLDILYINLYDGPEQVDHFTKIMDQAQIPDNKYKLRAHWPSLDESHGLVLNNRSGSITWLQSEKRKIKQLAGTQCFYPFYKLFVDWNADILFCANDWTREIIIGNLLKQSIQEIWMSKKMKKIRLRLIKGDRTHSPCSKCSVKGTLFGKPSFNILKEYYENSDNGTY